MGYFDALTSSYFKTRENGRRFFFPFGTFSRGYAIPSEQHYDRMRRQLKLYTIASLVLVIGASVMQGFIASLAAAALLIGFYLVWTRFLLRGLAATDERLTMKESMANQAHMHGAAGLWLLEIISLGFVAIGVVIFAFDPSQWLIALASIAFFGLCAVVFARMLMLRRRAEAMRP